MNKQEACILLDISLESTPEQIEEAYQHKIFEIRLTFLQGEVIPGLVRSRIKKVIALNDAFENLLTKNVSSNYTGVTNALIKDSFIELLNSFNTSISLIKGKLSASFATDLVQYIRAYGDCYMEYYQAMGLLFKEVKAIDNVKMTAIPDSMKLHQIANKMEKGSFSELEIDEQLILATEVTRCRVILDREKAIN